MHGAVQPHPVPPPAPLFEAVFGRLWQVRVSDVLRVASLRPYGSEGALVSRAELCNASDVCVFTDVTRQP